MKPINFDSKCTVCRQQLRPKSECTCPNGPTVQVMFTGPVGSKAEGSVFILTKKLTDTNGAGDTIEKLNQQDP